MVNLNHENTDLHLLEWFEKQMSNHKNSLYSYSKLVGVKLFRKLSTYIKIIAT